MAIETQVALELVSSPLTPKQESRLHSFAHLVKEATESWSQIRGGNKWHWVSRFPDGTTKNNFEITEPMINRMNQMAFNMYASEFYPDPKLKTFADAILHNNDVVKQADRVTDEQLNKMWNN